METHVQSVRVRPRPETDAPRSPVYDDVERLLVVRDDRLGDLVLTLPAIQCLRAAYPAATLALLVQPSLAPLAELFDPVDRVLTVGRARAETAATIRGFAPDAAVCISRRAGAAWALRRAGVRRATGTARRWFSPLFDRTVDVSRRGSQQHELEHALDLACRAGALPGPVRFPLSIPAAAHTAAREWLRSRGIEQPPIVMHPGSGGSCPSWPADRWCPLARELSNAGHPLVVSRGPSDDEVRAPFAGERFVDFDGGLVELSALLGHARLVLSNSTGPIHLAAALDRPALAIHAPWRSCGADRWGPWGERGRALVVGDAAGWSRRRRRRHATDLMRELGVPVVLREVESMLENHPFDPAASGCTL